MKYKDGSIGCERCGTTVAVETVQGPTLDGGTWMEHLCARHRYMLEGEQLGEKRAAIDMAKALFGMLDEVDLAPEDILWAVRGSRLLRQFIDPAKLDAMVEESKERIGQERKEAAEEIKRYEALHGGMVAEEARG
jgi:hypothetical protein